MYIYVYAKRLIMYKAEPADAEQQQQGWEREKIFELIPWWPCFRGEKLAAAAAAEVYHMAYACIQIYKYIYVNYSVYGQIYVVVAIQ